MSNQPAIIAIFNYKNILLIEDDLREWQWMMLDGLIWKYAGCHRETARCRSTNVMRNK